MATEIGELLRRSVPSEAAPTMQIFRRADRIRRRRRNVRTTFAFPCVFAIVATVVAAVDRDDGRVVVRVEEIPVPPEGGVAAERLADGSPVFVTHIDETVRVFAAFSTHAGFGLTKPISWCASARQFEDWMAGSWWDAQGRKIDGPAPSDLWQYEVVGVESNRVRIGDLRPTAERSSSARAGEPCTRGETPGGALVHDYDAWPSYDLASALDRQPAGLVMIDDGNVVLGPLGARICDDDGRCVDIRDSTRAEQDVSWPTRVMARVAGNSLYDVRVLDGWQTLSTGLVSCDAAIEHVHRLEPEASALAAKLTSMDAYLAANPDAAGVVTLTDMRDRTVYVVSVEGDFTAKFGRVDADFTWGVYVLDARAGGTIATAGGRLGNRAPFFDSLVSPETC